MKHIPERHQSVMPTMSVLLAYAALIALMGVIYVVVALAD